ncbi:type IV pilus modification protein PilV [Halomonas sp. MCCC 1A17488]|uniref:Type IV pilus modification protein PilV n=1 Tax=Billgrantia sulfidoxydans TaxID=2733484 RepID=A0ABX7WBE2_9GAMM|nr:MULTISPECIES: type IV pilus modification protein PilV [Halomonas]MCE8017898.1 type IV pilus modification protein PilV [Halomonas sp. MCCC 1A17488]MCG3241231.1 type IV pilus modification protein PilV [Halomonas sp. MCCC 1A17488]QPP49078.1 type IV pilus modification protein PilV [Halomonas sp. SS10-MC5]QTP56413.1 type IV pilus modification protein PilV [Halomonas sulfidoxydans]
MRRHAQSGFTLIEALIAVLVLSIGLLGVAAMQLRALQSAHMGYQRAVVSLAAIDAQERAWAELAADPNKACPTTSTVESGWLGNWFGSVLSDAGSDIDATGCDYTVTMRWQEDRYSSGETGVGFVYQFRLPDLNP